MNLYTCNASIHSRSTAAVCKWRRHFERFRIFDCAVARRARLPAASAHMLCIWPKLGARAKPFRLLHRARLLQYCHCRHMASPLCPSCQPYTSPLMPRPRHAGRRLRRATRLALKLEPHAAFLACAWAPAESSLNVPFAVMQDNIQHVHAEAPTRLLAAAV